MGLTSFVEGFSRVLQDRSRAEELLPPATRYLKVDGVRGWLYPVTTSQGDAYRLFAYFDGAGYQVKVVEPEVEGRYDPHLCHLLPDGRVCLSSDPGAGASTLEEAYTRSLAWCGGFSAFLRNDHFPF